MENADRWVAGFLEKFEEGCHSMVSYPLTTLSIERMLYLGIHCSFVYSCFQNSLRGQPSRRGSRRGSSRHNPATLAASYSTTATILMKPTETTRTKSLKTSRNSTSVHTLKVSVVANRLVSPCAVSFAPLWLVVFIRSKVGQVAMLLAFLDVCSGNARL